MEKNKQPKTSKKSFDRKAFAYRVRNVVGNTILALGSMGFVKQNLAGLNELQVYVIAAGVVGLIAYWTNKQ